MKGDLTGSKESIVFFREFDDAEEVSGLLNGILKVMMGEMRDAKEFFAKAAIGRRGVIPAIDAIKGEEPVRDGFMVEEEAESL